MLASIRLLNMMVGSVIIHGLLVHITVKNLKTFITFSRCENVKLTDIKKASYETSDFSTNHFNLDMFEKHRSSILEDGH